MMDVVRDPLETEEPPRDGVVSIGNFDGVHLGHQRILEAAVSRARELGVRAVAMIFDPHPTRVLDPSTAPRLLTTLRQRLQLLEQTGTDTTVVVPFDDHVAAMGAETFAESVLGRRLHVRQVFVGEGFRFGSDRKGTVELLGAVGRELGFEVHGVPAVTSNGEVVSSTLIRRAVAHGRVARAGELLGRPFFVDGRVFQGERFGRQLGFPTLNIAVENELHPAHGVYVTGVVIPSFGKMFHSVTNIGVRPTMYEEYSTTVESHLLDFSANVYEERLRLVFFERLRDEMLFDSPVHLVGQIQRDVDATRRWFAERGDVSLEVGTP